MIQPKLHVGPVDDPFEREADEIARLAMAASPAPAGLTEQAEPSVQRAPTPLGQTLGPGGGVADPEVEQAVWGARGGGQPVPDGVRNRMERVTGADLSRVRVHTGPQSDQLNDALGARAFTVGSDVFVQRSEFAPGTARGDNLLSHELTHTIQQGGTRPDRSPSVPTMQRTPELDEEHKGQWLGVGKRLNMEQHFYHATSYESAKSITKNGIWSVQSMEMDRTRQAPGQRRASGFLGLGFYTSTEKTNAPFYGRLGPGSAPREGIILEFVPRKTEVVRKPSKEPANVGEFKKLYPDYLKSPSNYLVVNGKKYEDEYKFGDAESTLGKPTRFWVYHVIWDPKTAQTKLQRQNLNSNVVSPEEYDARKDMDPDSYERAWIEPEKFKESDYPLFQPLISKILPGADQNLANGLVGIAGPFESLIDAGRALKLALILQGFADRSEHITRPLPAGTT